MYEEKGFLKMIARIYFFIRNDCFRRFLKVQIIYLL